MLDHQYLLIDKEILLDEQYVKAIDNAIPIKFLRRIQQAFEPNAPFWEEHNYQDPNIGYFSYLYSLDQEPSNLIEQIISFIWNKAKKYFPILSEAKMSEWWAHCRPHHDGHQLHFDSENEGQGTVRHPLVSTVLYLSEGIGGPTLVTTQKLKGSLATHGWFIYPKINRLTMFNANVLHGVIPGRGLDPNANHRRISFMIGFWTSITPHPRLDGKPGAAQPFPYDKKNDKKWIQQVMRKQQSHGKKLRTMNVTPTIVPKIWESVIDPDKPIPTLPPYQTCFQGF